jgi:hypothetical protein
MKKPLFTLFLALVTLGCFAQEPFRCTLQNKELNLNLYLNLYNESITVPGMEMFGPQFGYMNGNIYNTWIVTSCKVLDSKTASANFSNDVGSETQEVSITIQSDGTYLFQHTNRSVMKKAVGRKLVRLPSTIVFTRIDKPEAQPSTTPSSKKMVRKMAADSTTVSTKGDLKRVPYGTSSKVIIVKPAAKKTTKQNTNK